MQTCRFFTSGPRRCVAVAIFLLASAVATPAQSAAADLQWTIAPYLWAQDVGLDVTVNSDPVIGTSVPFKELVDKLDAAFMGHVEVNGEKFGAMFDAIYIKLADGSTYSLGPGGPILGDVLTNTELKLTLYELAAFYRFGSPDPGSSAFDLIAGARQIETDIYLAITPTGMIVPPINAGIDFSETDFVLGGRLVGRFNDKWSYRLRADYGSGGTEGTVNAQAAIGYTFGQTGLFSLDLGYRYMKVELEKNSGGSLVETEMTLSGPMLGFIFRF